MQILRPDMPPLIAGFIILFLFIIAIVGLWLVFSAWKNRKKCQLNILTTSKIVLGVLFVGFVAYNWMGYNSIFSENEALIIGKYHSINSTLTINKDHTWQINGDNLTMCRNGKWNFVMSEDWCFWNIESDNMNCRSQIGIPKIGAPSIIYFNEQNLIFERTK